MTGPRRRAPPRRWNSTKRWRSPTATTRAIEAGGDDVNSHFHYVDDARRNHDVWMLDAFSAWNE